MSRLQTWYHALPKAIRWLLTINVVVYVCWVLLFVHIPLTRTFFWDHLAFHTQWPRFLIEPWQFITYNFLHLGESQDPGLSFGSLIHIGFNMYLLYWFGREHEDLYGAKQLVALYLITGIGGGVVSALIYSTLPASVLGAENALVHGASASVLGVMAAMVALDPQRKVHLLLLGSMRLLYVVVGFLVLDMLVFSRVSGSAFAAHLGGALFGYLFIKIEDKGIDLTSWTRIFFREPRRRRSAPPDYEGKGLLGRLEARLAARDTEKPPPRSRGETKKRTKADGKSPLAKIRVLHPTDTTTLSLENEIDRILDKISEQGMESLTAEEKRVLEKASRQ